jgi:hypothetical protein
MRASAQLALYKGPPESWPKRKDFKEILHWAGKHIGHRAIQVWFLSIYSHAEIKIGSTGYSSSARDGGVRSKAIDFHDGKWDLYPLIGFDVAYALEYHRERVGWGYDYRGVASYPFPVIKHDSQREFCFEHVGGMAKMSEPHRLGPYQLIGHSNYLTNLAQGVMTSDD